MRFSRALADDSPFKPREFLRGKDARQLAHDLLAMSQEEFSTAFRKSPMKRAKLRGLKRNAAVVLGNVGMAEDVEVLTAVLDDSEPLVRGHAAWALGQIASPMASEALRERVALDPDDRVREEIRSAMLAPPG